MAKTVLQGTVKGARRRGRQKNRWEDNIKTSRNGRECGFGDSLRAAEDKEGWKCIVATPSVVPRRPPRLRDWAMRERESWNTICVQKVVPAALCFYKNVPSIFKSCAQFLSSLATYVGKVFLANRSVYVWLTSAMKYCLTRFYTWRFPCDNGFDVISRQTFRR